MKILITYDVDTVSPSGQKRLRQVARACLDYGQRVQNSVFECELSETQFILLKERISQIIDQELDSIRFYKLGKNPKLHTIILGKKTSYEVDDVFVI